MRGDEAAEGLTHNEKLGFLVLATLVESVQLIAEAHTKK